MLHTFRHHSTQLRDVLHFSRRTQLPTWKRACGSSDAPTPMQFGGFCEQGPPGRERLRADEARSRPPRSSDPPVSMARTTSRHRSDATSSGNVPSLSCRAWTSTAPSSSAALGCGSPSLFSALRRVASTSSCAPPGLQRVARRFLPPRGSYRERKALTGRLHLGKCVPPSAQRGSPSSSADLRANMPPNVALGCPEACHSCARIL